MKYKVNIANKNRNLLYKFVFSFSYQDIKSKSNIATNLSFVDFLKLAIGYLTKIVNIPIASIIVNTSS